MRHATPDDMPRLLEMGRRFHDKHKPEWPWDADAFAALVGQLPFVTITQGGFMAGAIAPMPLSPTWVIAHELLWWSEDKSGMAHVRAFRDWAKECGANEIRWSCHSQNDRVTRFYERLGCPVEISYSEVL